MAFSEEEAVHSQFPVLESGFTADEIQELLSLFQSNEAVYSVDERKKRRMISNRESARRSRCRKKRKLENLTEQLNQLKEENRETKNRLSFVLNQCYHLWRENEQLTSEYVALWTRLSDLCQILDSMQMLQ